MEKLINPLQILLLPHLQPHPHHRQAPNHNLRYPLQPLLTLHLPHIIPRILLLLPLTLNLPLLLLLILDLHLLHIIPHLVLILLLVGILLPQLPHLPHPLQVNLLIHLGGHNQY